MDKSILEAAHESVTDLNDISLVDQAAMCEFDALCLPKVNKETAKAIERG